jgi:hypothetical protein
MMTFRVFRHDGTPEMPNLKADATRASDIDRRAKRRYPDSTRQK